MQHQSPWTAAAQRGARPQLASQRSADVAVVGGGITGLTTALLLQRSGAHVVVVEADQVASGTTGRTTGKVTSQHGQMYSGLVQRHDEMTARLYGEANQAGLELVARLVDELEIDCDFARAAACTYTTDADQRHRLQQEADTAAGLGLPASFSTDIDLPFEVAGAVRFDNQAYLDAARYCHALADEITAGGGAIFERSRVTGVDWMRDPVVVRTAAGTVTADHVVVATLLPIIDVGGFFAKARPSRSYGIAVRLGTNAPKDMAISLESPKRSTRPWPASGDRGLIVVGDGHETGHEQQTQQHFASLEKWTENTFGAAELRFRWSAQDYSTVDELPYVGRSPRTTNCYVATGFHKWGLSNGTAAAMMLADLIAGRQPPWLRIFDSTRLMDPPAAVKMPKENLHVAKRFVTTARPA